MNIWEGKHGPLLIAEIGGNHEGDFEYALRLTELAIESGVDYIKYQLYSGNLLVSPVENPVRNKHFKKFELSKDQYIELANLCIDANVGFMASVWDEEKLEWINDFMNIYKVGSGDMTAYPVIRKIQELEKPIIISTGLSNYKEVEDVIQFMKSDIPFYRSGENIAVLQCTSMYPIPPEDANLSVMESFKKLDVGAIGYSDHTEGSYALEIAVAMGAEILEFHFTDSRENQTFRDHKVSLTRDEVLDLIEKISIIKKLSGSPVKKALEVEGDHVITFRRACYLNQDVAAGTTITEEMLCYLRPNHGVDARNKQLVIGKTTSHPIKAFEKIDLLKLI